MYLINELVRLVSMAGIEPHTLRLKRRCAIHYTNKELTIPAFDTDATPPLNQDIWSKKISTEVL